MWAAWAILVVLALPTVALDWYNTRDIRNVELNPGGFAWTVRIGPGDQAALRWIRRNLPIDATVQTDAETRGRATWALIPALARRRLVTGLGLLPLLGVARSWKELWARSGLAWLCGLVATGIVAANLALVLGQHRHAG